MLCTVRLLGKKHFIKTAIFSILLKFHTNCSIVESYVRYYKACDLVYNKTYLLSGMLITSFIPS